MILIALALAASTPHHHLRPFKFGPTHYPAWVNGRLITADGRVIFDRRSTRAYKRGLVDLNGEAKATKGEKNDIIYY